MSWWGGAIDFIGTTGGAWADIEKARAAQSSSPDTHRQHEPVKGQTDTGKTMVVQTPSQGQSLPKEVLYLGAAVGVLLLLVVLKK